jgi:hypothetical protein
MVTTNRGTTIRPKPCFAGLVAGVALAFSMASAMAQPGDFPNPRNADAWLNSDGTFDVTGYAAVSSLHTSNPNGWSRTFLNWRELFHINNYAPGDYFSFTVAPYDPNDAIAFGPGQWNGGFWLEYAAPITIEVLSQTSQASASTTFTYGSPGYGVIDAPLSFGALAAGPVEVRLYTPEMGSLTFSFGARPIPEPASCITLGLGTALILSQLRCRKRCTTASLTGGRYNQGRMK